jgi:hypothetical protein
MESTPSRDERLVLKQAGRESMTAKEIKILT